MSKLKLILILLITFISAAAQAPYKITYDQLKTYEGIYESTNQTKLKIAASPKDLQLYAIINQSKYPLMPIEKDVFLNVSKDRIVFQRDQFGSVTGYAADQRTFKLLSKDVSFPKAMWYARVPGSSETYRTPQKLKDGLPTGNLASSGLDAQLLSQMMTKLVDGTYPDVHSVLIIKDGKLVFEEYFYEYDRNHLQELRSASKSIVSALTGIAINQGLIKNTQEKVLSFFPEYTVRNPSEAKSRITIENLLTNQSGLDCDVSNPKSEGDETKMDYSDDWVKFTLNLPMIDVPGGKGMYCSGNPITLGRIIEKSAKKPLPQFAEEKLFAPLKIINFKWNFKPDKSNAEDYCQIYLTPREMAKFGLLYLNGGNWHGRQIVSSSWVEQSLEKHSVVQGVDYGYLWWLKYLDADAVRYYGWAAQGNGGQKIYIWKDQNMVTVITGGNYNTQSPSDELIAKYILPAFNKK